MRMLKHAVDPSRRPVLRFVLFAFCLIFPSTGVVQSFLGNMGTVAYAVGAVLALVWMRRWTAEHAPFSERRAWLLVALTFAVMASAFAMLFPIADAGIIGGGSDGDDALNVAVEDLLAGRFPYYRRTYLGNLITPLPGAVALAAPFALLGDSAYQNLLWLAALFLFARSHLRSTSSALLLVWTLLLSPITIRVTMTGIDDLTNSIYVVVFSLLLLLSLSNESPWKWMSVAVMLGMGLSSRANYLLLLPVILAAAIVRAGVARAVTSLSICFGTFAAVTLPFYLADPASFTPLQVQYSKVAQFDRVVPHAGLAITMVSAMMSVALGVACVRRRWHPVRALLTAAAVVQSLPVLAIVTLYSAVAGAPQFAWAGYGVSFLVPGLLAGWPPAGEPRGSPQGTAR